MFQLTDVGVLFIGNIVCIGILFFFVGYMIDTKVNKYCQQIINHIDEKLSAIHNKIDAQIKIVSERIDSLEKRVDDIERKIDDK